MTLAPIFLILLSLVIIVILLVLIGARIERIQGTITMPPKTSVSPPPWTGMTLVRWRQSADHTAFASALFRDSRFQQALEVLWSHHPLTNLNDPNVNADQQLGRLQGYRECIAVLESLALPIEPAPGPVPQDYSGDVFKNADDIDLNEP